MDKRIDISINNENRQQQKVQTENRQQQKVQTENRQQQKVQTVSKSGRQPLNMEVQEQKYPNK